MQKIIPNLWFDTQAEEAANFYVSTFGNSKVGAITRYDEAGAEVSGQPVGSVLTVTYEIEGYEFVGLNGGPLFTFTPAISFTVVCPTKEDVSALWEKLLEGGSALMPLQAYPFSEWYGWVGDKYGLTWQLIVNEAAEKRSINPHLMFVGAQAGKAEEAMQLYTSLFPDSSVGEVHRYGPDQAPDAEGTITHATFTLAGQTFGAMDSAHEHKFNFTEAISLMISCTTQEEIDTYWNALSAVPESEQCGWLKDKFGVSWQVTPVGMEKMLNDPNPKKSQAAMKAMLSMHKIDMAKLQEAYDNA